MSIALDIDGRRLTSLRRQAQRLVGRSCPAYYLSVAPADAEKRLLERARIPYATCEGSTIILGRHAADLAPLLHVPRLPLLPGGSLPEDDPLARQIAASLVESLLPEPVRPQETCALLLPQKEAGGGSRPTREWEFFSRVIRLRGYEPIPVDKRRALALAELGHSGFTGLTLTLDASSCGMALVHCGQVAAEAMLPRGGDWIDEQLARKTERVIWDMNGNSYVDLEAVERWKRDAAPVLHAPADDETQLLAYTYQQLMSEIVTALSKQLRSNLHAATLRQPLPLVCCGEPTQIAGFAQLLTGQIQSGRLPVEVSATRIIDDAAYTIARGGLIAAELESQAQPAAIPA